MFSRIGKASQLQLYKMVKIHINTEKKKKKEKCTPISKSASVIKMLI